MMNKVSLIIKREYTSRVRKKSFIVMTIAGPLLMASIIIASVWFSKESEKVQKVEVIDESQLFSGKLEDSKSLHFFFPEHNLKNAQQTFYKEDYNIILYVPQNILSTQTIQLFYKKQPGFNTEEYLQNMVKNKIETLKLLSLGINREKLDAVKTPIHLVTTKMEESGEQKKSYTEVAILVGSMGGILIYIFIFLYGSQVMRGVIEEKTSRIVEVIISSVSPFQLMMGKITGVALVGLTQFLLWVVLTFSIISAANGIFVKDTYAPEKVAQTFKSNAPGMAVTPAAPKNLNEIKEMMGSINFPVILGVFLFYFLGGYLLYSSLFAAIGAAVDAEADTQQFMLPITIPLVLAFIVAQSIVKNPESPMAFWFSIIPFTSPVVMMVRIPFGVSYTELAISGVLLIAGFIFTTWIAAKIYRTGILMYGKKANYKELWKWLFYKN